MNLRFSLFLSVLAGFSFFISSPARAVGGEGALYELRVYYANEGKLDELNARFRNHTVELFEKHGMTNIGYWVPVENEQNRLIYLLAHRDMETRDRSFKDFVNDPEWKEAFAKSTEDGRLVSKIDSIFLKETDYSPKVEAGKKDAPRLFELRTYTASEGNLENLHRRFRDHTVDLFSEHGMTHLGYWEPVREKDGAGRTLIYILAHKDKESRDASFQGFRQDPAWKKAKSESERDGSLTEKVESELMRPTDYSPTR